MGMQLFKQAFQQVFPKVMKALTGWGIGMVLMVIFCAYIIFLKENYNKYIMTVGAVIFLIIGYIIIDVWWNYRNLIILNKHNENKPVNNYYHLEGKTVTKYN